MQECCKESTTHMTLVVDVEYNCFLSLFRFVGDSFYNCFRIGFCYIIIILLNFDIVSAIQQALFSRRVMQLKI